MAYGGYGTWAIKLSARSPALRFFLWFRGGAEEPRCHGTWPSDIGVGCGNI